MKRTATFVPTAGFLLCPHCGMKYTASDGKTTTIYDTKGPHWEALRQERWQCSNCRKQFALPANPFKTLA